MTAAEKMVATPAEQLRERFARLKRSRIRLHPVHTLRASSIGHECERFLVYEQTATEMRQVHGEQLQALFDLGNHMEKFAVREIEEMGIEVLERARDYHDRELDLTGHVDGKLVIPGVPHPVAAEIKGLNPYSAERIRTISDIRNSRQAWVRKYYAQLQTYLYLEKKVHPELGDPMGIFALLNKVTGHIEFIDCPYDAEYAAELVAKAGRVRDAVRAKTLPDRRQTADCARCPFAHVCLPDLNFGEAVKVVDSDELIEAIRLREELAPKHREYLEADRALKALLPEKAGETLAGPYAVIGKEIERKAYSVPAGSYVKFDVRLIGKPPPPADSKPLNPFPPASTPPVLTAVPSSPAPLAPEPPRRIVFNPMGSHNAATNKEK